MLCVRCSHPLPSRADRCLRCFALNPPSEPMAMGAPMRDEPASPAMRVALEAQPTEPMGFDLTSEPPVEVAISIDSDPPEAVAMAMGSEPPQSGSFRIARQTPAPFLARAVPDTDPDPAELTMPNPVRVASPPKTVPFAKPKNLTLPFFEPPAVPVAPAIVSEPVAAAVSEAVVISDPEVISSEPMVPEAPARAVAVAPRSAVRASGGSRLAAWGIDASLLAVLACLQIELAAALTNHDFIDLALSRPLFPFWLVLVACDAITCSWLFAAAGRTPGMFALHQRLRTLDGGLPTPGDALQRALLSLLSAAPALFGFSFALFDSRGQTLHDKLCGCIVTVD